MNLTMVISSLECGGAERVLILLARGFIDSGYNVTVITLSDDRDDFYELPGKVRRINCNLRAASNNIMKSLKNNIRRVFVIRKMIISSNPDVVISFMDTINVTTIISLMCSKIPVIVTEHADPRTVQCSYIWDKLKRCFYMFAKSIVSPSHGIDSYFDFIPKDKRAIIPNPVLIDNTPIVKDVSNKQIIAIGRLVREKGFDLLITAFSKIQTKHPDWSLTILGEGNLRCDLNRLIRSYNLQNRVCIPGLVNNVNNYLKKSDIFILSSRSEGFGNVIIEAMGCGLPIISFDCPTGPRDIITDHYDGLLISAEDVDALASAIDDLILDEHERARLGVNALETAKRYELNSIMTKWQNLIKQ